MAKFIAHGKTAMKNLPNSDKAAAVIKAATSAPAPKAVAVPVLVAEAPKAEAPAVEPPKVEEPAVEPPKAEEPVAMPVVMEKVLVGSEMAAEAPVESKKSEHKKKKNK